MQVMQKVDEEIFFIQIYYCIIHDLILMAALCVFPCQHPAGCPCRFLTESDIANIPDSSTSRGVQVAVAGLLESSDGHVLLTRRAQHMRTFPCVWVPPGNAIIVNYVCYQAGANPDSITLTQASAFNLIATTHLIYT